MATPSEPPSSHEQAGWVDRSSRVRLRIEGPDRAKFLHNLTTNEVKRLAAGAGQETFVTSPQGKTLAYATLLALDDAILLRTDPASREALLPHLRKYGIFDDVAIEDVSTTTFEIHLVGPREAWIAPLGEMGGGPALSHRSFEILGVPIRAVLEAPTGRPGLTLIGPFDSREAILGEIHRAIPAEIDAATFEGLRIEAGTPISGVDVLPGHLPQEVGRDARAINFVKGCYLGQETVARLDALGHVNKILAGLRIEGGEIPPAGTSLVADGKPAGTITSAAARVGGGGSVAIGYVRVAQAVAGTRLAVGEAGGGGEAVVIPLPAAPG